MVNENNGDWSNQIIKVKKKMIEFFENFNFLTLINVKKNF